MCVKVCVYESVCEKVCVAGDPWHQADQTLTMGCYRIWSWQFHGSLSKDHIIYFLMIHTSGDIVSCGTAWNTETKRGKWKFIKIFMVCLPLFGAFGPVWNKHGCRLYESCYFSPVSALKDLLIYLLSVHKNAYYFLNGCPKSNGLIHISTLPLTLLTFVLC